MVRVCNGPSGVPDRKIGNGFSEPVHNLLRRRTRTARWMNSRRVINNPAPRARGCLLPAPAGFSHPPLLRSTGQSTNIPSAIWENLSAAPATGNLFATGTAPRTTLHTNPPSVASSACARFPAALGFPQTPLDLTSLGYLVSLIAPLPLFAYLGSSSSKLPCYPPFLKS
jgi:hypothetical protein